MNSTLLEKLSGLKKLGAYKHQGFWQCVDTIRDKEILENAIKKKNLNERKCSRCWWNWIYWTSCSKNLSRKKYSLYSVSKENQKKNKLKNIKYFNCDISKFKELKKKLNYDYDHIINLSGYIDHSNKKENINCHFNGSKNLARIFLKKKIKSFIQIGSSLEYGNQKSPQIENHKCKPIGSYGQSKKKKKKKKASELLKSYGKLYKHM